VGIDGKGRATGQQATEENGIEERCVVGDDHGGFVSLAVGLEVDDPGAEKRPENGCSDRLDDFLGNEAKNVNRDADIDDAEKYQQGLERDIRAKRQGHENGNEHHDGGVQNIAAGDCA